MASDSNIETRLSFIRLDEKARSALRSLKPMLKKELPAGLDAVYGQIRAFPEARAAFRDEGAIHAAQGRQLSHWDSIVDGRFGADYERQARAAGETQAQAGVDQSWQIGGYALLLDHLIKAAVNDLWPKGLIGGKSAGAAQAGEAISALVKASLLDIDFAVSAHVKQAEIARDAEAAAHHTSSDSQAVLVNALADALGRLSSGDLTVQVVEDVAPDYQRLKDDFNSAAAALREAMSAIVANTDGIRNGADEIAQSSDDLSRRTEHQAASLEETAAALDQLTANVKKSAAGARQASEVVDQAKGEAQHSGEVVRQAVAAMGEIEKSSHQISQIIGVIDEIAFQTNLLALNAGVEAARAGEAGRGFAVVAQEVRALAQRSAEAAKQIKGLISASSAQVGAGVDLVGQTGDALDRIVSKVAEIDSLVSEISASSQEQATGLAQVNTAVNEMDQVTQQNAAMVEESTAASHTLRGEAAELIRLVSGFRVGAPPRAVAAAPRAVAPPRSAPRAAPTRSAPTRSAPVAAMKTYGGSGGGSAARKPAPQSDWEEF
jgi:methyl-accepting chemotaxis protein